VIVAMSNTIILYDLPGTATKDKAFSENTWKTRFILNMKGLPYKTVWVEYPDIAPLCQKIGAEPTRKRNGKPLYTLPVIHDPTTGASVSDSLKIAYYLDDTYPSTTPFFPPGSRGLQSVFVDVCIQKIEIPIFARVALAFALQLSPPSEEFFRNAREQAYGKRLEDVAPEGETRDAVWNEVRDGFRKVNKWMNANGKDKMFMFGDTPSFADVSIMGNLIWLQRLLGSDSMEWKDIMAADDGRWAKLTDAFAKWEFVDEEGLS